ncbi:hypothetical protein FB45DRAFT_1078929 [Roridomyces roridus]|uniref:F-box domain-containing protein n=1 Tax=Roridomyces roridus TaxID=1738132 RepID=A0AAD7FZE7_9AGAR|nr:hypothetical protein FB45DRAFT_1078929 [Roridomyces roridus]
MHASSRLRRVASPHLLFRLGISQSDVHAGTVKLTLSESLHLIVFVAHICPIQRLNCFEESKDMHATEFQRLALILGAVAPIPDIFIHDKLKPGRDRDLIPLHLLAHLPQTATDNLLIVWNDSTYLSRPCGETSPPKWACLLMLDELGTDTIFLTAFAVMVTLPVHALCLLVNLFIFLLWVCRRVFERQWSTTERISNLARPYTLRWRGGIHVQSLSTQFTLVTCREAASYCFVIKPLRGVPDAIHSMVLASLDLESTMVTVKSGSNVAFAELAHFVTRQKDLRTLTCAPNSIRPSSLVSSTTLPFHFASKIKHLRAPVSYIPHLLPLTPHVQGIDLSFPSSSPPTWLPVLFIGAPVFDYAAYCTALTAIARLPGSQNLSLSLTFDLSATSLPWQSTGTLPEAQLHRVWHLKLCTTGRYQKIYTASTIRALRPWLARFPRLRPMEDFPDELLDRVCSFMGRKKLCTAMHISPSLRRVASAHLLCRLCISQSDVRAGTVKLALSDSLHLILFVAHICPIQRLECFAKSADTYATEFQRLALILAETAPIPDILIHDKLYRNRWGYLDSLMVPRLLAHLPQSAANTPLIVWGDRTYVSRPRAGPSPPELTLWKPERGPLLTAFLTSMSVQAYFVAVLLRRSCLFLAWAFRPVCQRRWSTQERISEDVSSRGLPLGLDCGGWIRVQNLLTKCTLVTRKEDGCWTHFIIEPLRGIPDTVYSAFLASLDPQYTHLTVKPSSGVTFAELAAFVVRQKNLRSLDSASRRTCLLHPPSPSTHSARRADISFLPLTSDLAANHFHRATVIRLVSAQA